MKPRQIPAQAGKSERRSGWGRSDNQPRQKTGGAGEEAKLINVE